MGFLTTASLREMPGVNVDPNLPRSSQGTQRLARQVLNRLTWPRSTAILVGLVVEALLSQYHTDRTPEVPCIPTQGNHAEGTGLY